MIVPFDPSKHDRFVYSAFCHGACEPRELLAALIENGAKCAVRTNADGSLFMGYAVVTAPQEVAWAYTKLALRNNGIMTQLLEHLGVDVDKPMVALFPSVVASKLRERGWPIGLPGKLDIKRLVTWDA